MSFSHAETKGCTDFTYSSLNPCSLFAIPKMPKSGVPVLLLELRNMELRSKRDGREEVEEVREVVL